jgi:transposase InsO family protein
MDKKEYEKLIKDIEQNKDPTTLAKYILENDQLYLRKDDKKLKVIQYFEKDPLMWIMHDHPTAGHFASKTMYEKLKERYYWKGMKQDIEEYVRTCDSCQRRNRPNNKHELHSIKIKEPWYQMGIDIVGPLPRTQRGKKYIVVAMDYFTKWPEARALTEATAEKVSEFIYEDIICRHGCPKKILSDRGSHFNNKVIQELTQKFEIKHGFSTPYHPKTNGLVERFNKTLCESLAKLTEQGRNWDEHIPSVLFAYRTKQHSTTKIDPFYLTYGRNARLPIDEDDNNEGTYTERITHLVDELPIHRSIAKQQNLKTQALQKKYHDKNIKVSKEFEIGDKVLQYDAAKDKQWSGKLEDKWKGPYYIHEVLVNGSYKLKEFNGKIFKTPVNGELLKQYFDRRSSSHENN